jgi:hypothetical protein
LAHRIYLGFADQKANASGHLPKRSHFFPAANVDVGDVIPMIAIAPNGDTSEFSECETVAPVLAQQIAQSGPISSLFSWTR